MTVYAALLLSASLLSPFKTLGHFRRAAVCDQRVEFVLHNTSLSFEDVKIEGKVYTVLSGQTLSIKAPAGMVVYAASRFGDFRPGDAVLTVKASLRESGFDLR